MKSFSILAVCLTVAACLFAISPADSETLPNLLANQSFETNPSGIASGWQAFSYRTVDGSAGQVSFFRASSSSQLKHGTYSQGVDLGQIPVNSNPSALTRCGVYQQIAAVPGKVYHFTCWILLNTSTTAQAFSIELGIDPHGGTNPEAAVWGASAWNNYERIRGIYNQFTFSQKAQSSAITVFIRISTMENVSRSTSSQVFFDHAGLFAVNDDVYPSSFLANPDFEQAYNDLAGFANPMSPGGYPLPGVTDPALPNSWVPFGWSQGYTDVYDYESRKTQIGAFICNTTPGFGQNKAGMYALRLLNNKGTCDWGVYQRVSVTGGQTYTVNGFAWGQTIVTTKIGLDPTGGVNPDSPSVIWNGINGSGSYNAIGVMATAQTNTMTVFLRASGASQTGSNEARFDDVYLSSGALLSPPTTNITSPTDPTERSDSAYLTINWSGGAREASQVRICTSTNPNSGIVWDSGVIEGYTSSLIAGPVTPNIQLYIFARMRNSAGWGNWSPYVRYKYNAMTPGPPVITAPAAGSSSTTSQYVTVTWTGDAHDAFEVNICSQANPSLGDIWTSGVFLSSAFTCTAGPLSLTGNYYIYVRLRNNNGWGPWSAARQYSTNIPWRIIPEPQQTTLISGQSFNIAQTSRIIVPSAPSERDLFTANQLRKKIFQVTGNRVPIVNYVNGINTQGAIAIGQIDHNLQSDNLAVTQILVSIFGPVSYTAKSEGSVMGISSNYAAVGGFDESGTFYGCQSIIQLLEQREGQAIPAMKVYDWPDLKRRGVLLRWWGLYGTYDPDFAEEVMSEVVSRFKMNTIQLELRLGMYYDSAPLLPYATSATTKQQTKDMVRMMKRYHIDVVACGMSSTHADQWITSAYPQFAIPGKPWDLDMTNPTVQQWVKDMLDEQIEVCKPSIVHVGGDEGSAGLTATLNGMLFMRDHLLTRGMRMAIWGDMIKQYNIGSQLPNDIIIQDWDYNSSKTNFIYLFTWTNLGLTAWVAPYGVYVTNNVPGPYNIYYSGTSAKQYGTEGLVAFNKAILGEKNQTILSSNTPVPNDYALTNYAMYPYYGDWSWTTGRPTNNPLPYNGREMFLRQLSPDRPQHASASYSNGNVQIDWRAPINSNTIGARVYYRFDRFPKDVLDGTLLTDIKSAPDAVHSALHQSAPAGATIFYSIFAYDRLKHFSPPMNVQISTGNVMTFGQAKAVSDGQNLLITNAVVSAVFPGEFYIQDELRTTGTAVLSNALVQPGDRVNVAGAFGVVNTERKFNATAVEVIGSGAPPTPLSLNNLTLGGGTFATQEGVWSYNPSPVQATGLSNIGLLVRVYGKVTQIEPSGQWFYIDDGSDLRDGTMTGITLNEGIRILQDGRALLPGQIVEVTGASSCFDSGGAKPTRQVKPKATSDIVLRI